jgi:hypothetical protein
VQVDPAHSVQPVYPMPPHWPHFATGVQTGRVLLVVVVTGDLVVDVIRVVVTGKLGLFELVVGLLGLEGLLGEDGTGPL